MPQAEKPSSAVRFEGFELDLRVGELRQNGAASIRLSEQPFRILTTLIEHAGDLVLREEIRKTLWPNDTVVEFEHSINAAMKRLRQALGDSAESPRYIETLPRRGYRWIMPVVWVEAAPASQSEPIAADASTTNLIGKRVSHYRVLQVLGGGGMGVVYKAEDLKLGRRVALKFLPEELGNDPAALERFEREARSASALDHPNICAVYEFAEHEGRPFLAMQFLEGTTLRDGIESASAGTRPFNTGEFLTVATQIAEGLNAAHQAGIIHRDIKPANVFVTTQGQAKILDFGLAKLALTEAAPEAQTRPYDATTSIQRFPYAEHATSLPRDFLLTRTGLAMGTAGYMSPEQLRGERLDARSDLFSFGLVLYEMATGKRPFAGHTAAIVHDAILNRIPTPARELNPDLPSKLDKIITKALEKDRDARYQSAAEMLGDLNEVMLSLQSTAAPVPSVLPTVRSVPHRRWLLITTCSAAIAIASLSVFLYVYHRKSLMVTEQDTLVLADFANSTGDSIFDDTLKQALRSSLQQSPFLDFVSDRRVGATLSTMARPSNTPLTPDVAREVCRRVNSKAYISGAIAALGSEYVLQLKAVNCQTAETLSQQQTTVESKDKILAALGTAATKLREQLGESLTTVGKFDIPLNQTTPSLEALREYNLAMKVGDIDTAAEISHFLNAIQIDPNFAMAYLGTAESYANLNQGARATEYFIQAFQLRDHADEREKLEIESQYYAFVTGELDKAADTYQRTMDAYPTSPAPYGNLSMVYSQRGQYEKAVGLARQVLQVYPKFGGEAYQGIAEDLIPLQQFEEAHKILQSAIDRKLDIDGVHKDLYALAFLEGDPRALSEQAAWFQSKTPYANLGYSLESDTAAYTGRLAKSRELTKQAVAAAVRVDSVESGALWLNNAAVREALFGNAAQARRYADAALKMAPGSKSIELEAALAFALAGDARRAELIAQGLAQRFPLDTQVQSVWLPAIDAQLLLVRNKPSAAIDRLRVVTPIELGSNSLMPTAVSCMYAIHIRGEAYLAAADGAAAATEFKKIIDHDGIVWNCATGALAKLGLARANAVQARTDKGIAAEAARTRALTAYSEFLALWKDADPDIAILKQAKAEYTRLQ